MNVVVKADTKVDVTAIGRGETGESTTGLKPDRRQERCRSAGWLDKDLRDDDPSEATRSSPHWDHRLGL
ncbi:MAG: hypothetical protein AAFO01_01710 [Pseudomonadota bacterium]